MRSGFFLFLSTAGVVAALFLASLDPLRGQSSSSVALTGQVSSFEEGSMEGVLVSARRAGSTFTFTVVSDQQGRYRFTRRRLEPGYYSIRIRAVGYDLVDPGAVQVTSGKTATVDLRLHKTQDLSSQLTSAEWLLSMPGTDEEKSFLLNCTTCHTLERIAKSRHNADEWMTVYQRMGTYYPEITPYRIQKRVAGFVVFGTPERLRKQAEWMATINLSAVEKWTYPLKTFPRPTDTSTQVVITEYDLPRPESVPHDLTVDSKHMIWYDDSNWQYLGKLDPKTAKVSEFPVPKFKPDYPVGMLDLQADKDENLWLAMMDQGKIAKFNTKTLKFQIWDLPREDTELQQINFLMPLHDDVDAKVWTSDSELGELRRLDVRTGRFDLFKAFENAPGGPQGHRFYEITADSRNNCYFMDIGAGYIGRVDARTGKITFYQPPTPNSGPRRGEMDSQDRLWFGEYRGNRIGMFDTRSQRFEEWKAPNPWTAPYGAALDKNGAVWSAGITTDRVQRLDPRTGRFTEYLLPRYSSLRRFGFENSGNQVTFWAPNKNSASILRVEPLDNEGKGD
jgi:virginiamycin B lyase